MHVSLRTLTALLLGTPTFAAPIDESVHDAAINDAAKAPGPQFDFVSQSMQLKSLTLRPQNPSPFFFPFLFPPSSPKLAT